MRRRGLRLDPPDGWPLDKLLVGVATVRTIRELIRLDREWSSERRRREMRKGGTDEGWMDMESRSER